MPNPPNPKMRELVAAVARELAVGATVPAFVGAQLPTRTVVPMDTKVTRQLSSIDAAITPGSMVVLANWQGKQGGAPATLYASLAPEQGSLGLASNVQLKLQIRRGAVVRIETFPWPGAGMVRRLAAEEIVVTAIGRAPFVGGFTSYRIGAAVQDGEVPDDFVRMLCSGTGTVTGVGANVLAPVGARAFRALKTAAGTAGPTAGFEFSNTAAGGAFVASGDIITLAQAADWVMWPASYNGLIVTSDLSLATLEFAI